ncbi:MAG TPA: flagellar biosynthetic protein FliO [Terracidiphilus sp.]|jgi:flagellar biogenesis protein FliO
MTTTAKMRQAPGREWGLAAWLLGRLRGEAKHRPSLALLERITLAPRQSLSLVEAEGRRFLVATSAEGSPTFHALDESTRSLPRRHIPARTRISW